jgi:hypothetical protein
MRRTRVPGGGGEGKLNPVVRGWLHSYQETGNGKRQNRRMNVGTSRATSVRVLGVARLRPVLVRLFGTTRLDPSRETGRTHVKRYVGVPLALELKVVILKKRRARTARATPFDALNHKLSHLRSAQRTNGSLFRPKTDMCAVMVLHSDKCLFFPSYVARIAPCKFHRWF